MTAIARIAVMTLLMFSLKGRVCAQSEANRIKIELTVSFGGKTVVTELNSVASSLNRSFEETAAVGTAKDTAGKDSPGIRSNAFYLSMDVKRVSDELLRVFAKKQNQFDGSITIVDTYGKIPTRTIRFKKASLFSYSDQFSAASYGESAGSSAISFGCQELSVNGIALEL